MNIDSKKEIVVTIVSSILVVITTIAMGLINEHKEVKQVFVTTPNLDKIDFIAYLGLQKGLKYKYDIYSKESSDDKGGFIEEHLKATARIIERYNIKNGALFVLDNNILEPTPEHEKQGILVVSNLVYQVDNANINETIKAAKSKDISGVLGLDLGSPVFTLPFFDGQKQSDDCSQFFREDHNYQYYVQKEGSSNYFDGKKVVEVPIYKRYYITSSDTEYIEFIPYIGITEINYHHNGSVKEKTIYLSETVK